jgi:hypothetical protein
LFVQLSCVRMKSAGDRRAANLRAGDDPALPDWIGLLAWP